MAAKISFSRYLRGLECLRQLVFQLTAWVDGVNAHDGNPDGAISPNILKGIVITII